MFSKLKNKAVGAYLIHWQRPFPVSSIPAHERKKSLHFPDASWSPVLGVREGRATVPFSWSSLCISHFKWVPWLKLLTYLKDKLGGSEVMSICHANVSLCFSFLDYNLENQQITQKERWERDLYSTQSPSKLYQWVVSKRWGEHKLAPSKWTALTLFSIYRFSVLLPPSMLHTVLFLIWFSLCLTLYSDHFPFSFLS